MRYLRGVGKMNKYGVWRVEVAKKYKVLHMGREEKEGNT